MGPLAQSLDTFIYKLIELMPFQFHSHSNLPTTCLVHGMQPAVGQPTLLKKQGLVLRNNNDNYMQQHATIHNKSFSYKSFLM